MHITLCGYYGFYNTGDEAILTVLMAEIYADFPEVEVTVLAGDPEAIYQHYGVQAIAWGDLPAILQEIQQTDLVVIGGGGLFHDYWGVDIDQILRKNHLGIPFFASIATLAHSFHKPLAIHGVGVGPLLTTDGKRLTVDIFNIARFISVRDHASVDFLSQINTLVSTPWLTGDLAFQLKPAMPALDFREGFDEHSGPILGVALRSWNVDMDQSQWEDLVVQALDYFIHEKCGRVVFIPFQQGNDSFLDDVAISKRIQTRLKPNTSILLDDPCTPAETLGIISRCDYLLGMRLHALIFALSVGVPVIGMQYDPKVQQLLAQFDLETYTYSMRDTQETSLTSLLDKLMADEEVKGKIQNGFQAVKRRSDQTAVYFRKFLAETQAGLAHPEDQTDQAYAKTLTGLVNALYTADLNHEAANQSLYLEQKKNEILEIIIQDFRDNTKRLFEKSIALNKALERVEEELVIRDQEKQYLDQELTAIKLSRGWKLIWRLWQLRLAVIPKHSLLDKAFFQKNKPTWFITKQLFMLPYRRLFKTYLRRIKNQYPSNMAGVNSCCQKGLVSIVLPTYNGEQYIQAAIESILNQTYSHFELILVDDGSTDKTRAILDAYAAMDSRLKIVSQSNQKLPAALNAGFKLASGEFYTWTSDDNIWHKNYLAFMVKHLRKKPAIDMVFSDIEIIGEEGERLINSDWFAGYQHPRGSGLVRLPRTVILLNLYANNTISGAFLYRSRAAALIGSYSTWQYTREDYDYWMRINEFLTICHVKSKKPLYQYRFHSQSLTTQDKALKITENRVSLMIFDDFRRDYAVSPVLWVMEAADLQTCIGKELSRLCQQHGHILFSTTSEHLSSLSGKFLPLVYIKVLRDSAERLVMPDLPANTLKAAYIEESEKSDFGTLLEWDVVLHKQWHNSAACEQLDRRHWFSAKELPTLIYLCNIAVKSRLYAAIEQEIISRKVPDKRISVVICTYQRNEKVLAAIESVLEQDLPSAAYEVIVVNNQMGNPWLEEQIKKLRQDKSLAPGMLRYIQCPIPGLSFARNTGIMESDGEFVLFLDDDSLADRDLLYTYVTAFEDHPDAALMGGQIIVQRPDPMMIPWKEGWEKYWSHFVPEFSDCREVNQWGSYPWGANWCARRDVLLSIGGFRTQFGRKGHNFNGGEELVAASLIQQLGHKIYILPQAKVIHDVDSNRFTLSHVRNTITAGLFSYDLARRSFYLPSKQARPSHLIQMIQLIRQLGHALFSTGADEKTAAVLEVSYRVRAIALLFLRQVKGWLSL